MGVLNVKYFHPDGVPFIAVATILKSTFEVLSAPPPTSIVCVFIPLKFCNAEFASLIADANCEVETDVLVVIPPPDVLTNILLPVCPVIFNLLV